MSLRFVASNLCTFISAAYASVISDSLRPPPVFRTLPNVKFVVLQIISLNTNIYYRPNGAIDPKEADPGQQFSWLRDQLKNASTEGYKVRQEWTPPSAAAVGARWPGLAV